MSINSQAQGHDVFDVLEGSVSNHFAQIESVLMRNECVQGAYNLVTAASYASNCPVDTPGFTKVCFSTNGSNIADLENSYIEADLEYTLRYSGPGSFANAQLPKITNEAQFYSDANKLPYLSKFFIGFKQSLDALERYDIYCNSQLIYSQPFVGHESTVLLAGLNDTIRENNPFVYTSFNNASTMDANVCGVYVDLKNIAQNNDFTIKIPVKINLHQFLLLSPIHYLPSFCGRWEIQLYFGSKNLVICPVNPLSYWYDNTVYGDMTAMVETATGNAKYDPNYYQKKLDQIIHTVELDSETISGVTHRCKTVGWANYFTQINCKMPVFTWDTTNKRPKWEKMTLSCTKSRLTNCLMNVTQFQLKYEVYQGLMQRYVENPLIIPTNTLSYQRFAHANGDGDAVQATANLPCENIDALFVLIPEEEAQQTCFYQPYLTGVRMGLGEFGIRPQRYMDTCCEGDSWNNRRFYTYLLDALNLETSQISAMNKDFANSVLPHGVSCIRKDCC